MEYVDRVQSLISSIEKQEGNFDDTLFVTAFSDQGAKENKQFGLRCITSDWVVCFSA